MSQAIAYGIFAGILCLVLLLTLRELSQRGRR
jgi:hypothetical protein